MSRPLLVALALFPAACAPLSAGDAEARDAFPRGEVVFRPECFADHREEKPMPSSNQPVGNGYGSGAGRAVKKDKSGAAPPPPPSMAPSAAPMMEAEESAADFFDGAPTPVQAKASDDAREIAVSPERVAPPKPTGPVRDWGGTVYLSNDDSMSLASAQRVLYAVKHGVRLATSEIRPHELLNYFSFDTVTPDADEVFDVLASAEQDGDQLSVALAIKGATPPPDPLDLTLIVDVSCSMQAEGRMAYTQRGMTQMTDQLNRGDRVDVVLFDDRSCVPLENYVVGRDDPKLLQQTIDRIQPVGGTNVDLGLREGYRVAKSHLDVQGRNRRMMILTDAQMNTGDVNPNTVSEIGKAFDADGIRLTGVGVGRDFNDKVLDMLTEKGKGAYVDLGSAAVVDRLFGVGFPSLVQTIAHDVHFALKLPPSLAMERFYGEESSKNKEDVQPIHYYAGTSQLFLQDLSIKDGRAQRNDAVDLEISYRDARTGEPQTRTFRTTVGAMLDADPHNVRKGLALMAWTDLLMEGSMGGEPCKDPLRAYAERAGGVADDAEIAYVNSLIQQQCGAFDLPVRVASRRSVSYKVKIDADIPIAEVALACGRDRWSEALTTATTVARFDAPPGACELTLSGNVEMRAAVDVPTTGGDVRCVVRGGRVSCS